jgi:pimeloyl-ACP methyl ester carboxylesterase
MRNGQPAVFEERTVGDRRVRISPDRGKPLMLLVRLFPYNMGLWDKIWNELAENFTVATFNLRVPDIDAETDPRAVFHAIAADCVTMAKTLGHERFHIFGWHGGAQVALRLAIDFPERVISCTLQGAIYEHREQRPTDFAKRLVELVVGSGDLEFLTNYVLLTGVSAEFAEAHYADLARLVERRIEIDKGRLNAHQALRWGQLQRRYVVSESELDKVTAPVLLVAPVASVWPPYHQVRRLYDRMPTAELATIARGGDLVLYEDPEAFFAATWRFLRAASRGEVATRRRVGSEYASAAGELRALVTEAEPEEAVVFLHGWLMSPAMWDASIEAIGDRARCIALWQPAHGTSSAPPSGFSMMDWADWLASTLDRLGVKRAVLVGHSMGGMLIQAMLARYPERVRGLVLVGTQATAWDEANRKDFNALADVVATEWSPELAQQCADLLLGKPFQGDRARLDEWKRNVAGYDLRGMSHLARAISDRPDLSVSTAAADIPVLVVHGSDDAAIPVATGRDLAATIPGARLVELSDCGHCPPLEAPQRFAEELARFVATV